MKKCNYTRIAKTWQEREVGCPLDHCMCGSHDAYNAKHKCDTVQEEVRSLEIAAGWDSSP